MTAQAVLVGVVAERPKRTPGGRVYPAVDIPPELVAIGIDVDSFCEALDCRKKKSATAWALEFKRLAPLVEELGGEAVFETWLNAAASSWQGCTPSMVRSQAARGRRPPPSTYGRMNQGDDIAERARRRNGGGS